MKVTFFKLHAKNVWLEGDSMIVIRWLEGEGCLITCLVVIMLVILSHAL